jgi:hypothetical protein
MPDLNDSSIRMIYVGRTLLSVLSVAFDVDFEPQEQESKSKTTDKSVRPTSAKATRSTPNLKGM